VHKIVSQKVVGAGLVEMQLQQIGSVNASGLFQPMLATVIITSTVYKTIDTTGLISNMKGTLAGDQIDTDQFQVIYNTMSAPGVGPQ
jgi:hypothetical protein